jgi:hypothetical protein
VVAVNNDGIPPEKMVPWQRWLGRNQEAGLLTAIMPLMARSERNPHGLTVEQPGWLDPESLGQGEDIREADVSPAAPDFQ